MTACPSAFDSDEDPRCECGHVDTNHKADPETGWGRCEACVCEAFQQAEDEPSLPLLPSWRP